MKASRFFIGTLKEAPAEAEIVSHQLMIRAGMIRRVAGGIYSYLPIGLRSVRKVETIVREEMNRAAAIELLSWVCEFVPLTPVCNALMRFCTVVKTL